MKILVTNDDGINARGIRTLAKRLAAESDIEVYVCAPDRERSATGHALTLHKPLHVEEIEIDRNIKGAWYLTGTPSDCVKFATDCLLRDLNIDKVDYVISGINNGANLGTEILYSGTVSAAMEGAFLGLPSIAVSVAGTGYRNYDVAAEFIVRFIRALHDQPFFKGKTLLNVNVPNVGANEVKGAKLTTLGIRAYKDWFEKRVDPRGRTYYWLAGEVIEQGEKEDSDAWTVANNMISVTPIAFNMTDNAMIKTLEQWGQIPDLLQSYCATNGKTPDQTTSQPVGNKEKK